MEANIRGQFYDAVIMQCARPKIVDVSAADYVAEAVGIKPDQVANAEKLPFIIAHPEAVTLKVETWTGVEVTWQFTAGPYPMPLKRIIKDVANTATTIQISY